MRRHALAARAALGGAEAILALIELRPPVAATPATSRVRDRRRVVPWAVAAGVVALFLALWGSGLVNAPTLEVGGNPSPREDELAGHPDQTPSPSSRTNGEPAGPTPQSSEPGQGSGDLPRRAIRRRPKSGRNRRHGLQHGFHRGHRFHRGHSHRRPWGHRHGDRHWSNCDTTGRSATGQPTATAGSDSGPAAATTAPATSGSNAGSNADHRP